MISISSSYPALTGIFPKEEISAFNKMVCRRLIKDKFEIRTIGCSLEQIASEKYPAYSRLT
jgi:hypothetical protein